MPADNTCMAASRSFKEPRHAHTTTWVVPSCGLRPTWPHRSYKRRLHCPTSPAIQTATPKP
eukprot:347961-Chlamydomonas_euryale.AAC.2